MPVPSEKSIRAFIAIRVPPPVQELSGQLKKRLGQEGKTVSWVKPANVHLTLKFLGNISEKRALRVKGTLEKTVAGMSSFRMQTDELGVFPHARNPRVIWLGLTEATGALIRLEKNLSKELEKLGFERERKKFTPHITLGRIRSNKEKDKIMELIETRGEFPPHEIFVDKIELIQSDLKPTGAVYSVLSSIPLG